MSEETALVTSRAEFEDEAILEQVVTAASAAFPSEPTLPITTVSFALLKGRAAFPTRVNVHRVADLLNHVGSLTVAKDLRDVQFYLQERTTKTRDGLVATHGVVMDVDHAVDDPLAEVTRAGLPKPTFIFPTLNGFKPGYVVAEAFPCEADAVEFAQRAGIALGADPKSWDMNQAQRLPQCLKETEAGVVSVDFTAVATNGVPLDASPLSIPFPHRVLTALGSAALTAQERAVVEQYLDELGAPVPPDLGTHVLRDRCPLQVHSKACTYVQRGKDGSIRVHCLGSHGPRTWSERELFGLAACAQEEDRGEGERLFDPLRHLPVTWAGREFVLVRVATWSHEDQRAAVELWMRHSARRELEDGLSIEDIETVHRRRLLGVGQVPPQHAYFNELTREVWVTDTAGKSYPVANGKALSTKAHAHAFFSSAAHVALLHTDKRTGETSVKYEWQPHIESLVNSIALGNRDVLRITGVPSIVAHEYPVAFLNDEWRIEPKTLNLSRTTCAVDLSGVEEIDPVDFFKGALCQRRIPLATQNDVLLFVALIASPLLRELCPGLLGIYWFVGPPGAGKEFLVAIVNAIWSALNPNGPGASFEIQAAGDMELKRSMEGAKGAIFARVKEAGKRGSRFIDEVIRLSTTDRIPARGVGAQERYLPNYFTFVADSAEDVPDRREISRRALPIRVAFADDNQAKSELLDEAKRKAPGMIRWLLRKIEGQGADYFRNVKNTGSRPLAPVALARMLGATLPPVEGEDMDDLFEALLDYVLSDIGREEGVNRKAWAVRRAGKESKFSVKLPSYRFSHFVGTFKSNATHRETLDRFGGSGSNIATRIAREAEYGEVANNKREYLFVEIGGERYAFRLEGGNRRFILIPEQDFKTAMAPPPALKPNPATSTAGTAPVITAAAVTLPAPLIPPAGIGVQ